MASLLVGAFPSRGVAEEAAQERWRVWLEPRFMHQPVVLPIAGAEKTEWAAGVLESGALEPLSREAWQKLGVEWPDFLAQARANVEKEIAGLKPSYTRNRRKIIEYAEVHLEQPIAASLLVSPRFRATFQETLGPEILVVIPNRNTLYVFPKLASSFREYAPMVLQGFRETTYPVSLEVFELAEQGIRAIGKYPDPGRD